MTTVIIEDNRIEITGHAGEHDVCVRISFLYDILIYNLAARLHIGFDSFETDDAHNVIRDLNIIRKNKEGRALLEAFIYSLTLLEKAYPDNVQVLNYSTRRGSRKKIRKLFKKVER